MSVVRPRDLVVLFCGVVLAAAIQEFAYLPIGFGLKAPCLLAVAVYYGVRRDGLLAAVAAGVCGLASEGLSAGVPAGVDLLFFFALARMCRTVVRRQMANRALTCAAVGGAAAALAQVWQAAAMVLAGVWPGVSAAWVAGRVLAAFPVGAFASLVFATGLRVLDWASANIEWKEEGDELEDLGL